MDHAGNDDLFFLNFVNDAIAVGEQLSEQWGLEILELHVLIAESERSWRVSFTIFFTTIFAYAGESEEM
jgi:hypothetical protein